jgi:hypothetical protein
MEIQIYFIGLFWDNGLKPLMSKEQVHKYLIRTTNPKKNRIYCGYPPALRKGGGQRLMQN